jgi:hypothetical protein
MQTYASWSDVPHYLMTRHGAKSRGYKVAADAKPVAQMVTRPGRTYDLYLVDNQAAENDWMMNLALQCDELRRVKKAQKGFELALIRCNRVLTDLQSKRPPRLENLPDR